MRNSHEVTGSKVYLTDGRAGTRGRWGGSIAKVPHMSRQNKVNPGMYTQRGRLTQDDAARELRKQASIGSQSTWQPVQKDARPRPTSNGEDANRGAKMTSKDNQTLDATPVKAKAKTGKTKTSQSKSAKPKAVLARNVGGGRPKPRPTAKRRKS